MLLLPAVSGSLNRLAFHAPLLLEPREVVVVSIVTVREDPQPPPRRPSTQASVAARLTGFIRGSLPPSRNHQLGY